MINAALMAAEYVSMLPQAETPAHTEGYEGFFHVHHLSATEAEAELRLLVRDHDRLRFEKRKELLSILAQLLIFNTVITAVTLIFTCIIGESSVIGKILLLFLSNLLMQLEIAMICLGISSFLRRSGLGIGIGIAFGFYFLNILSNLSDKIEYLKFITPFGYTDGAAIIKNGTLEIKYLTVGLALTGIGIAMAYKKYISKDIA
jgi:ABC-2 type transport system permease protein